MFSLATVTPVNELPGMLWPALYPVNAKPTIGPSA